LVGCVDEPPPVDVELAELSFPPQPTPEPTPNKIAHNAVSHRAAAGATPAGPL